MQAKAQAQSEQLQREKLAGEKKIVGQSAEQENAAYKLLVSHVLAFVFTLSEAKSWRRPLYLILCFLKKGLGLKIVLISLYVLFDVFSPSSRFLIRMVVRFYAFFSSCIWD